MFIKFYFLSFERQQPYVLTKCTIWSYNKKKKMKASEPTLKQLRAEMYSEPGPGKYRPDLTKKSGIPVRPRPVMRPRDRRGKGRMVLDLRTLDVLSNNEEYEMLLGIGVGVNISVDGVEEKQEKQEEKEEKKKKEEEKEEKESKEDEDEDEEDDGEDGGRVHVDSEHTHHAPLGGFRCSDKDMSSLVLGALSMPGVHRLICFYL